MKTILLILISFVGLAQKGFDLPKLKFDDKAVHFYVAAGSAVVVGEIVNQCTDLEGLSSAVGAMFGISITLAKDFIYDKYFNKGVFSIGDIIAGCMGAVTGGMLHRVIIDLRQKHKNKQLEKLSWQKETL